MSAKKFSSRSTFVDADAPVATAQSPNEQRGRIGNVAIASEVERVLPCDVALATALVRNVQLCGRRAFYESRLFHFASLASVARGRADAALETPEGHCFEAAFTARRPAGIRGHAPLD